MLFLSKGRNSHFSLTVERDGVPWPALEATPSDIYSEALVLLRVKDAGVFKDAAGTHIALQVSSKFCLVMWTASKHYCRQIDRDELINNYDTDIFIVSVTLISCLLSF